jgi:transposase InsO family protein
MSTKYESQKPAPKPAPASPKAVRRYSAKKKAKALTLAARLGVKEAATRTGVSAWTLYMWRAAEKRAQRIAAGASGAEATPEPVPRSIQLPPQTVEKIVVVWRNNAGFGPSQVHYQLRRVGVKVDTKTIRKVMVAHGYRPPTARPPRPEGEGRRFEASRPLELVQMDVLHFYVHSQRVYLILAIDDHSRFVIGWGLLQRETMDDAIAVVEEAIRRYGKPEAILTDRGAAFHAWSGVSRFDRMLESYDIDHRLAAAHHPQTCGKIEALNKSIQKELIKRVEFRNFLDAKEQIGRWVDSYNHERTHQGIGGVLVPADRFFGRADRVLARIEKGCARPGRSPVPPALETPEESREIALFQIRLVGETIELWLFGRRVGHVKARDVAA